MHQMVSHHKLSNSKTFHYSISEIVYTIIIKTLHCQIHIHLLFKKKHQHSSVSIFHFLSKAGAWMTLFRLSTGFLNLNTLDHISHLNAVKHMGFAIANKNGTLLL